MVHASDIKMNLSKMWKNYFNCFSDLIHLQVLTDVLYCNGFTCHGDFPDLS